MIRYVLFIAVCCGLSACIATRPEPAVNRPPAPQTGSTSTTNAKTSPYVVFGQRYYPITDATGYRERGVASWYGGKFHGRKTANGELYDMHELTAAHTTLPLPTRVKVTNLRNGATVTVRVNDRGPFVKNRLIDLSYAAASRLGMIEDGTTLVEIEAVPMALPDLARPAATLAGPVTAPMPVPEPPVVTAWVDTSTGDAGPASANSTGAMVSVDPAATSPNPDNGAATIYVQVGAFGERGNAERLQSSLYNAGIDQVRLASGSLEGIDVHRVQVGPVGGVAEYDILIARLESIGINETHLVTE